MKRARIESGGDLFSPRGDRGQGGRGGSMTGPEKPIAPPDRKETVRRKILSLLSGTPLSALQLSARVGGRPPGPPGGRHRGGLRVPERGGAGQARQMPAVPGGRDPSRFRNLKP